jgi:sigma-B regulation protein RsbU (phosphoserine phosphatase)
MPAAVLVFFTLVDLLLGRDQAVLGVMVLAPMAAATALGRRATVAYGVLALAAVALLGIYDRQYTAEALPAQSVRLFGLALGGVLAVVACTLRLRREQQVARLSAQAAADRSALHTAETLQRHLLGAPPVVPGLETAVRYLPASRHAQVGGDWYDAFLLAEGTPMLVIGDVAGHDASAAATMAQVRGMLRAIAQSTDGSPATVLSILDQVLADLALRTLMTVAVATVEPQDDGSALLCWSNAGHPPPVLACADGRTQLLAAAPEQLLGVAPGAHRTDHSVTLRPGDTLLLYTDGLVERRRVPLDEGFDWLRRELQALAVRPLAELCDELLAELGGRVDDDVALLAVRLPEAQAGLR